MTHIVVVGGKWY